MIQVGQQILCRGIAPGGFFGQHALKNAFQGRGNVRIEIVSRRVLFAANAVRGDGKTIRAERVASRKGFVEHDAQGKDIRAAVGVLPQQNLRCHVGGGSVDNSRRIGGQVIIIIIVRDLFGHAEVQNLDLPGGREHDIFGLDVAVDQAAFIGRGQSFGALARDAEKFLELHGAGQSLTQSFPVHVLHEEKDFIAGLDHVVHGGNLGLVAHANCALSLLDQAPAVDSIVTQGRRKSFEGDRALQAGILGAIDFAHAAHTEAVLNDEAVGNRTRQGIPGKISLRDHRYGLRHTIPGWR